MNKLYALLIMFLPSSIKVSLLRSMGHSVDRSAHIGFSYLDIKNITLGEKTYIGAGNIFTRLDTLQMESGSRITRWNRFTSSSVYHGNMHLKHHASISLRHYFDVCDLIQIGANTIIAGHRSTFFTHSKGVEEIDYTKPIVVGDFCYLGSDLSVAPGAIVGDHCFVGMGSVLVGDMSDESYCLMAGNPAKNKRSLPKESAYFLQGDIVHPHLRRDG